MTKIELHRVALALAAIGALTLGAAYAQTDAPSGQAAMGNEGGMMRQEGMMHQMSEMMAVCAQMMQAMPHQDGAPEAQPDRG